MIRITVVLISILIVVVYFATLPLRSAVESIIPAF